MDSSPLHDYRAARSICEMIAIATVDLSPANAIAEAFEQCEKWRPRAALAQQRDWQAAAHHAALRLTGALEVLQGRTRGLLTVLPPQLSPQLTVSPQDIVNDIRSLRREFDEVQVDLKNRCLTVRTDNIVLDELCLGPFDIRLRWKAAKSFDYRVIAVDPNPASSNSDTTHPHVHNESLCEGEGATAIRRALAEGRIYDFFCIVDRILKTYNEGSAYVSLNDWSGIECSDCGRTTDADTASSCERCQIDLCGDCLRTCGQCSDHHCSKCILSCHGCGDDYCRNCLKPCKSCRSHFCPYCLNQGICDDCVDQEESGDDQSEVELEAHSVLEATGAEVHSVCVEQTSVSA
ncbi:MAG: hypothetical protein ACO1RT_06225 [Planctomycetaceae bacterium]